MSQEVRIVYTGGCRVKCGCPRPNTHRWRRSVRKVLTAYCHKCMTVFVHRFTT